LRVSRFSGTAFVPDITRNKAACGPKQKINTLVKSKKEDMVSCRLGAEAPSRPEIISPTFSKIKKTEGESGLFIF